ncbi:MAG: YhfC family glutamic-type intramembrane protease [Tissierellia bacterium]|nr:YhfC family glutamic-type intramembrane protease [Tissierellia bacterium]
MNNFKNNFRIFILGFLSFTVSQVLLRLPLLKILNNLSSTILFATIRPLLYGAILAFSAGLFEESGRFIIKKLALKPYDCEISEPIIFGLGHSISEIVLILSPFFTGSTSWNFLSPIFFVERFLTTIVHIGLTIMVWNGFIKGERIKYLIYAIFAHFIIDFIIPIANLNGLNIITIESILAIFAILLLIYSIYSKKFYKRREN